MALEGRTVDLPEAIRKITSLPAHTFNLEKRGKLQKGFAADIVIFNPDTIRDQSTFHHPHALAKGMQHIIINGTVSMENQQLTNLRNGQFL
jgi:N-acyl-D-amino-acid deacylase